MPNGYQNLRSAMVALALSAVMLATSSVASHIECKEMTSEPKDSSRKVLDIERARIWTRLVSALHDMPQAAGHPEWSPARLHAVLGNAFSFEMRNGGGAMWQEANLDWWLFLEELPKLDLGCRILSFQVQHGDEPDDIRKTKVAAWEAVRASIDQGVPAAAYCPMASEEPTARDWGLIVGYDEVNRRYTVRRRGKNIFTVRYDALEKSDRPEGFCVLVYGGPEAGNASRVHVRTLQNAIAFANGTRYDLDSAPFKVDARGLAAFELWRKAIQSEASPDPGQEHPRSRDPVSDTMEHAGTLKDERGYAAAYLRELAAIFPVAATELEKGAAHYGRVAKTAAKIWVVCKRIRDAGRFTGEARTEVSSLISTALQAERDAIVSIEAVLALVEASE